MDKKLIADIERLLYDAILPVAACPSHTMTYQESVSWSRRYKDVQHRLKALKTNLPSPQGGTKPPSIQVASPEPMVASK